MQEQEVGKVTDTTGPIGVVVSDEPETVTNEELIEVIVSETEEDSKPTDPDLMDELIVDQPQRYFGRIRNVEAIQYHGDRISSDGIIHFLKGTKAEVGGRRRGDEPEILITLDKNSDGHLLEDGDYVYKDSRNRVGVLSKHAFEAKFKSKD